MSIKDKYNLKINIVKKVFLLISAVAILGSIHAQNSSDTRRFVLEVEHGTATSINYSALSAFEDSKESYSMPTVSFFAGVKSSDDNNYYYGISVESMAAHTAQPCQEMCYNTMALLSHKRSLPLWGSLNVWCGAGVGAAWIRNQYVMGGDNLKINRYGLAAKFEGGLIYNINNCSYVGLTGGFYTVSYIKGDYNALADYTKNGNNLIFGQQIMLNYGVRF